MKAAQDEVMVGVYEVTRHYGGAEEGGWWYNWYDHVESVVCAEDRAELIRRELMEKYEDRKHGNIYSVLGGADIVIRDEDEPGEHASTEQPHYC